MKWFKHDSDASNDAKLKKLRLKYGAQGYGIYWYCLELIARNVEKHNLTFELEHDAELIADDFKLSADLVQHIMTYMVDIGLFENTNGIISCLKMATRTDEYTQKLIQGIKKSPDTIPTLSVQSPTKSVLIEEKREEENRKELYIEVLDYLNRKASKNYKPVRANLDLIKARINEGYTKEDMFTVIDNKCNSWLEDKKMNEYLRPATLFNATNLAQYTGEESRNSLSDIFAGAI
jgi:uncharacterized phage protein (TIGR02220 family)